MKIIIGSESFPPNISGVAVFAKRTARYLVNQGHEVYVFTDSQSFRTYFDRDDEGIKILRFASIPNPFRKGFYVAWRPTNRVKRELDSIKPDVIHIQDPASLCGALVREGRRRGIPVVATNHFSLFFIIAYLNFLKPIHPLIKKVLSWYFSRFYSKCTLLTTPSATAAKNLKQMGVRTEIRIISNGVDLNRFHPADNPIEARQYFNLPDKPTVIYIGRIDKDKSIPILIKAMRKVIQQIDACLLVVGGGDELENMKKLAGSLGIKDKITFTGRIDSDSVNLPLAYQAGSLFAIPSTIETQSIVTLEALATGLPLVAADATCMPEFIEGNNDGFLFQPGSETEMAKKIVAILKDHNLAREMGRNARKYAEANSIDRTNQEFEKLYEEISKCHKKYESVLSETAS